MVPGKLNFLVLFFLVVSLPAFAGSAVAEFAGQVVKVTGEAFRYPEDGPRSKLSENEQLPQNAVIETGKDSFVQILLSDRSVLKIGAQTRTKLDTHLASGNGVSIEVPYGRVKAIVKKRIDAKRSFLIRSPSVTMGVRGTEFVVSVSPETKSEVRVNCFVLRGSVQISDLSGKPLSLLSAGTALSLNALMGSSGPTFKGADFHPQQIPKAQSQMLNSDKFLSAPLDIQVQTNTGSVMNSSGNGGIAPLGSGTVKGAGGSISSDSGAPGASSGGVLGSPGSTNIGAPATRTTNPTVQTTVQPAP